MTWRREGGEDHEADELTKSKPKEDALPKKSVPQISEIPAGMQRVRLEEGWQLRCQYLALSCSADFEGQPTTMTMLARGQVSYCLDAMWLVQIRDGCGRNGGVCCGARRRDLELLGQ